MHWFSVLSVITSAATIGLAKPMAPRWDDMEVKHSWDTIPDKWEYHSHPPDDVTINLRIALTPHRENALIEALYEVSDPGHPKYGQHLSKEQVAELVAAHPDTIDLIGAWLEHHDVPASSASFTHGGSWLTLSGVPVAKADALLSASYRLYRHKETNETILRTLGYSLPAVLHDLVQTIAPTSHFISPNHRRSPQLMRNSLQYPSSGKKSRNAPTSLSDNGTEPRYESSCSQNITPSCLRQLYHMDSYIPRGGKNNTIGLAEYFGGSASQSDLTTFMASFGSNTSSSNISFVGVNGGANNESKPSAVGALNTQYIQSLTFPTKIIYYVTNGAQNYTADKDTTSNTNEPYMDWLDFVLAGETVPQTIISPFGDDEQTVPADYAKSVCNLFARLGSRGASVLFPSGDQGVAGIGGSCVSNNGTKSTAFVPMFPASCPYVTTVGGTTQSPEVAYNRSGGGFSNYFKRPWYQNSAVSAYLSENQSGIKSDLFNSSGRAYPDISAQAINFTIILNDNKTLDSGTGASATVVAAVVSLLNDYLISEGKSSLGFLNPWLYSTASSALNDITKGGNPTCDKQGFQAATGWDPVTGLGTPDFSKLKALLQNTK